MNNSLGLKGDYRIEVKNEKGELRYETDWFDNLILNQGLDRLGVTNAARFNRAMVGTGTIAPDVSQTALQAPLAVSATSTSAVSATNSGAPLYETLIVWAFSFSQGAVVGNITEIGVGWDNTNLFSRALIADGSGNPISITLTAIDQLTVYYRLTVRQVLTDSTGVVTISGVPYSYVGRPAGVGSSFTSLSFFSSAQGGGGYDFAVTSGPLNSGWWGVRGTGSSLGPITGTITGGTEVGGTASGTYATYTTGTYYRDSTISMPIGSGNASGGIVTMWSYWNYTQNRYQWQFTPAIPKDNTKTLSLTFRSSWSRLP